MQYTNIKGEGEIRMKMKILELGVCIMAVSFTTFSYGINHKLLDSEAETYSRGIVAREPIPEEVIRYSLSLAIVRPEEKVDAKYTQPGGFSLFYQTLMRESSDEDFKNFATTCHKVYITSEGSPTKQIITYLLLESVKEKFDETQKRLEKRHQEKKREEAQKQAVSPEASAALYQFVMHADTAQEQEYKGYLEKLQAAQQKIGLTAF